MLHRVKFLCLVIGAFCLGIVVYLKIDDWQLRRKQAQALLAQSTNDSMRWLSDELQLSAAQTKEITSLYQKHQDLIHHKLQEIEAAEKNIQKITSLPAIEPSALQSAVEKAESLRGELRIAVWNHISQTKAALQPTQAQKYQSLLAQRVSTP
jgi:ABC-type xylose transport system substrate-binding protein